MRSGMSLSMVESAVPLALIVVVGGFLSYRSREILRQDRDLVVHTYQVIGTAREVMIASADAETGQRGFLITGDPAFLAPYEKARDHIIPDSLADLGRLLVRNAAQQKRLQRLRTLIQERFTEIQTTLDARRNRGFEAARTLVAAQDDRAMKQVRVLVATMEDEEQHLLKQRSGRVAVSESRILWVAGLTAVLSIATRLFIAMRASRRKSESSPA